MLAAITTCLALALAGGGGKKEGGIEGVEPDLPNLANSTKTVPPRALQLELGVDAQVHGLAAGDEFRVAVPMNIRVGITKKFELRLFDGDPWRWLNGQIGARQQGEISIGAKIRFWERETKKKKTKLSLGVQPQLIPVSPFSGAKFWAPLPGASLLFSAEPGEWEIDLTVGAKMSVADDDRCCGGEGLIAASFSRSLAKDRVKLWTEAYTRVDLRKGELGELSGDAGLMVLVVRHFALDAMALVGRVDHTLVVAVLGGMSVRFGP